MAERSGHQVIFASESSGAARVSGSYDAVVLIDDRLRVDWARSTYPAARVGILDPKLNGRSGRENARCADFLVVSSLEQQLQAQAFNSSLFVYPWFLSVPEHLAKTASKSRVVRIGYHGNRQHLEAMGPTVSRALDRVSQDIELLAIYNIHETGRWTSGRPRRIAVEDVQWEPDSWMEKLSTCDIGVVPALIPPATHLPSFTQQKIPTRFGLNPMGRGKNDFIARFKFSSNLNRVFPFAMMGIPVVADLYPSATRAIDHGRTGFLAYDEPTWTWALEQLASSAQLRYELGQALNANWPSRLTPRTLADGFLTFLSQMFDSGENGDKS